jgi:hypothetical protein
VAALVGSFIVQGLSDTDGFDWIETIVQVALAAVAVFGVAQMRGRGGTAAP